MRVLSPTCRSLGDVEPLLELVERSPGFGTQVRVCTSPDFAELPAWIGVPPVPTGASR
jgi:vancomycin aglycone glucosyltransferase